MASSRRGIGLLGGSFDPVHKGHLEIIQSFLDSGYINLLYVILSPNPPHKENRDLTDFKHRYKMLQDAMVGFENLSVSTIEKELPKPSYTINTISHFNDEFPNDKLYLCIGEDSYVEFTGWYKWEEILKMCKLLVASRPEAKKNNLPEKLRESACFIEHEAIDISSSEIREKIRMGDDVKDLLPDSVWSYIKKHRLYGIDNE
jgi:nicotinate-nucleotide adenylyltransferase